MEYDYIGAIKIKDGLFLGDQFAAQDLEFIVTNKVSRIVNCSSKQIPNHWESIGITYLSYPWMDNESQAIFQTDEAINTAIKFIDDGLNLGESVIVHSVKGHNRSIVVLCVYFMKKYRWTLYKTLQYMHNRRPDLEIRANFFNQLLALESRFQKNGHGAKTYNWDEVHQGDPEETVLRNTYLNAQSQGVAEFKDHDVNKVKQNKITFAEKITLHIPPYDKIVFQKKRIANPAAKQILKDKLQQNKEIPTPKVPQDQVNQRPASQDIKRIQKSDSYKQIPEPQIPQQPQASGIIQFNQATYKPKKNNFMDSGEQFFMKQQQAQQQQQQSQPQQLMITNTRRPQTAPVNQLRAPRLQVTPYKKNNSSAQKPDQSFKPIGNRQRAFSPNQTYNANPYAQKQFKTKAWKK